jgi:predicted metalloprotease with PDZ domain
MKHYFIICLLVCTSAGLSAAPAPTLNYTISPLKKGDYRSILIKLSFKGNASGSTALSVPFDTGLYRPQDQMAIQQIANSTAHTFAKGDSGVYQVQHKPGALVTLAYTVTNALKDSLPTVEEVYAQMFTPQYFYVLGHALWITPRDSSDAPYNINIQWQGLPAQWHLLNTYGANQRRQSITASIPDFLDAIYMGGDIRIHQLLINEKPLYFGIRGQWAFADEAVFDIIKKTVSSQRAYWNDYAFDQYTIALIPMKYDNENVRSVNGRGLSNTFVSVGTNSKAFSLDDLLFLYNHELMHHWLGHILKQGEPENAFKWFHEGFTDYFAHVIMLESGLLDPAAFTKRINDIFRVYYSDSAHQWPNTKLQLEYWSSPSIHLLPYQRGLIFAFYLDESIRRHSTGRTRLKDVVQQMLAAARKERKTFSPDWFLAQLQQTTGKDYTIALEQFITKGIFINMPDWQAVSDKVDLLPAEDFYLGFQTDRGMVPDALITNVDAGSNAAKAGLAAGDRLAGYSYNPQSRDSASIVIKRGLEKMKFRYLPVRQMLVPQLK